jgi:hypothetical protein
MLLDENDPKMSLALLMLHEAYARGVTRIELHRREACFTVLYLSGQGVEERDVIDNRHWHSLLAAFHTLASETVFGYAMMGPDLAPKADALLNRIEIGRESPGFNNGQLRALQRRLDTPLAVAMSFTDTCVELVLRSGAIA